MVGVRYVRGRALPPLHGTDVLHDPPYALRKRTVPYSARSVLSEEAKRGLAPLGILDMVLVCLYFVYC